MSLKLPYYMVYPMPLAYDEERVERRDYEYMESLYPNTARKLIPFVEEECDRCECPCSMMYDEYPDRLQLHLMCRRIYDHAKEEEKDPGKWLQDLIEVMVCQELCRRRQEHRGYKRRLY